MAQSTRTTMGMLVMLLSSTLLTTLLLSGGGQKKDKPGGDTNTDESDMAEITSQVSIDDIRSDAVPTYDCQRLGSADKRSWCLGLQAWNGSQYRSDDATARNEFIEAWRRSDAQQAQSAITNFRDAKWRWPVMKRLHQRVGPIGVVEYECSEGAETDNDAVTAGVKGCCFRSSRMAAPDNAVLRGTYINSYMSFERLP